MQKIIKLVESNRKELEMSPREKKLKKELKALLKDDGKGHHHAKYADRLDDFNIHIVPLKEEPLYTASIDFEDGVINVGEGFLTDKNTFFQLNVVIRHELAHSLLMHQIRMMHKIGSNPYSHIKYSQTLHGLLNIIEDYEISNKVYNAEDKEIIRHLWINGQEISCLVTELDRPDWQKLSVEEMYIALSEEVKKIESNIRHQWADPELLAINPDYITREIGSGYIFTNVNSPCQLRMPLSDFVKGTTINAYPDEIKNVIKDIYYNVVENETIAYTEDDIKQMKQQIAKSSPYKTLDLVHPQTGEVVTTIYTPEEKQLALEALKNILMYANQYQEWYEKVVGVLSDQKYTDDDLKKILNAIASGQED